jgi:hypothetical protein
MDDQVQSLIHAVAKRHKLILDVNDPVLVTATLHEELLSRHLAKIETAAAKAEDRNALRMRQEVDAAKEIAARLITESGRYVEARIKEASDEAVKQITAACRGEIESSRLSNARRTLWNRNHLIWIVSGIVTVCTAVFVSYLLAR